MKQELKEIKISALKTSIYIEQAGQQEEPDRIKIYDSDKNYCNYLSVGHIAEILDVLRDADEVLSIFLQVVAKKISSKATIDDVLFAIGLESYTTAKKSDLSPILKELFNGDLDGYEQAEKWDYDKQLAYIKETGYANRIGNYIVLNTEDF